MRFLNYNEYMSIVLSTNNIFDFWFFQKRLDCNPVIFSTKKEINRMPLNEQTKSIIAILKNQDAADEIIDLFTKRSQIETIIFSKDKKKNIELINKIGSLKEACQSYA